MRIFIVLILSFSFSQVSWAQVNSIFTASPSNGCSPLAVSFTDLSTGNPTSWNWNLGNGNTSTQQNPGAVYITPGSYFVSLTVTDGVTSSTSLDTIVVYNNPAVNFIADDSVGCSNLNVTFTNLSVTGTGIASALWNFGDGSTSNAINPTHNFTAGIYDITLIVTSNSGCVSQLDKLNYINSISAPTVNFTGTNTQNCAAPTVVTFTNTSTNAAGATYFWSFGDGTTSTAQNPVHQYNSFGSYNVKLVVNKNGCIDSIQKNNFVVLTAQDANFTSNFTTRCTGQAIQFTDISTLTPTTRSWNFGDGSPVSTLANPTHTYTTAGVYTVTLTTTLAGCNDVETKLNYITINARPTADFVADRTDTCAHPFPVQFTPTTSAVTNYAWTFGDGTSSNLQNPLHVYNTSGSFNVNLVVTNAAGCTRTINKPSYINIVPPVANFDIDTAFGCFPKTIQIVDLSTSANPITNWFWDFGDGTPVQNGPNNPSHTYVDTGTYEITLVVEDGSGCTDTLQPGYVVQVGQPLLPDFSATPVNACKVDPIVFTNLTDTLGIEGVQWLWDFGDGGTLTSFEPTYEYGDTGTFEVSLTVTHNGCASSISYPDLITINPAIALFSTETNCDNYSEISFIDNSVDPDNWTWNIAGNTFNTQDVIDLDVSLFPVPFVAQLIVENNTFGCIDSISTNITPIFPVVDFDATDSLGCAPFTAQFNNNSTFGDQYIWDFGDGSPVSNATNPSHVYTNYGVYTVQLIVRNTLDCWDTLTYNNMITVIGSDPMFSSPDTSGCRVFNTSFVDLTTTVAGPITNWSWDFGDGSPLETVQNPTHSYSSVGTFDVSLTTTDSAGCVNTLVKPNYITVTGPLPSFNNVSLACVNSPITFTNTSTSLGGTINTWLWNFGDGNTSNVQNPIHSYTNSGIYSVSLYLEDNNGCDTTFVKQNIITIDSLTVDFSADSTIGNCTGFIVNFQEMVSPNPISWNWDFGNGNTSNIANPSTVFSNVGNFDVTLITENIAGCRDTLVKPNFIIVNGPTGVLSVSEDTGCIDFTVDFSIVSPNSVNQIWDFGDGTVISNTNLNFTHTYTNVNVFNPLVILEDAAGCLIPYYFDTIYTGSIDAAMYIDDNYICTPDIVNFADSSRSNPPVSSWLWAFGDGNTSTLQNPNNTYIQDGVFDVSLIVDNGLCTDTVIQNQTIVSDASTLALFTYVPPALFCPPANIVFNDLSTADSSIVSWNWDFGNGNTSVLQNPASIDYTASGTYFINLDIVTIKGCIGSFSDSIVIQEIPTFNYDLDTIILCVGDDTTLASIQDNANITWTPIANLSCSDCPDPTISGLNSTTYFVNATNTFGCSFDDTLELIVSSLPPITVSEDQKVLAGSEVDLSAFSAGVTDFVWSPTENLSCNNCADNIFTANETTEIIVSITDQFGCENMDTILVEVFNMCEDGFLLFPNVFTPNNDNQNDVFKAISRGNLEPEINYFRVFDRWGKLVFESTDIDDTWDGNFNGKPLNNGVYVYVVDVVCADGNNQMFHGNVTIIR